MPTGGTISPDVRMVELQINPQLIHAVENGMLCLVRYITATYLAQVSSETKYAVAMCQVAFLSWDAPTELFATLRLVEEQQVQSGLIVGVQFGFLIAQSKAALMSIKHPPWIGSYGRKGDSAASVAIGNASLLASGQDGKM